MTLPFSDWPHLVGAPTEEDVEEARRIYQREAARPTLAAMRAQLRHQYGTWWLLELVGERDGRHATYFSEDVEAGAGTERDAAEARLLRAGYPGEWVWTQVDGGWNGTH